MTLSQYVESLRGKRVTVIGLGVSNRPLVRLLLDAGVDLTVRDAAGPDKLGDIATELLEHGCRIITGEEYLRDIEADVIFRSPGVMPHEPEIAKAVEKGAVLTSEMEAFFEVCPCPIYAVTGSDGKTTTTTVIAEMLKAGGKTVHVGGNIGTPLLDKADGMKPEDVAVLELSSFQLMTMKKSPTRALVTNVAPNHLDKHKTMDEYVNAKRNIFQNTPHPQVVVLNADNDITRAFAQTAGEGVRFFSRRDTVENGTFCENGTIFASLGGKTERLMEAGEIFIPGDHNVENYLGAFALLYGTVDNESMVNTARTFRGVEHRIELVRELRGVKYYNDSIASSPSRTRAGLRSFDQKVILIAGGKDKGVPFDSLGEDIQEHVKALVLTGLTADKIEKAAKDAGFDGPIIKKDDFKDAVLAASAAAGEGDVVILSPACTSFDRFKNFAERGNTFKEIVMELE